MTSAAPLSSRREQALDWLLRLQQSPDDPLLRGEFEQWCASDAANAQAYYKAERVWQLTGQLAPTTTEQWPRAEVVALPVKRQPRRRWWLGAAVAACLLVAVAPSLSLRLQADYRTAQGETRDITLADGSVVQLDSDTAIAVDYSGDHRDVKLLTGQAFFEVMPDKAKPFHVRADHLKVTVTGTAFNVEPAAWAGRGGCAAWLGTGRGLGRCASAGARTDGWAAAAVCRWAGAVAGLRAVASGCLAAGAVDCR